MFNPALLAAQIKRNVRLHLAGKRTRAEFDYRARKLWAHVSQGESRIVGSACAARHTAVQAELSAIH